MYDDNFTTPVAYETGLVVSENLTGLDTTVGATVDATVTRRAAASDVTFTLQWIQNLEECVEDGSHAEWTDLPAPTEVENENGTTSYVWSDLQDMTGSVEKGFVRLYTTTPCDTVGAYSLVQGWEMVTHEGDLQTEGVPMLNQAIYTGMIDSNSEATLLLDSSTNGDNVADSMGGTTTYYLEITSGDYEGHRFDLAEGGVDTVTIDTASVYNTASEIPDLSGSHYVIRAHHTIGSLYRNDEYTQGYTQSAGDQIHVYNATGFDIYYNNLAGEWIEVDDRLNGNDVIIPPGVGVFVKHAEEDSINEELRVGEVRYNSFIRPLVRNKTGLNHIAMGYPVDCSPDMLSMRKEKGFSNNFSQSGADQIRTWDGDHKGNRNTKGYTTFSHNLTDKWYSIDDKDTDRTEDTLFSLGRSPFIEVKDDVLEWKHEMPYSCEGWTQP